MMIRTDRRRFPILIAAIAALAVAMALLFSPVQAQEGSAPAKPTGLSATASHDQVVLTWDDPVDMLGLCGSGSPQRTAYQQHRNG